jgi:RNA ligase (TIGR02306 family)
MSERKLLSVQQVDEIAPIEGADAIEHVRIGGWWVVDKKGNRKVGDLVGYAEIDSFIPTCLVPYLSKGKEPREYQGIKGERLRTVKLRGAISQGLLLDLSLFGDREFAIGDDLTEIAGIVKWEPPAEFKSADAKGSFPAFIPKTDQERIQSVNGNFAERIQGMTFEVTEKCEGSSMTLFANDGEFGICSRNLLLKDDLTGSSFVDTGVKFKDAIMSLGRNIAFQGELIGPAIQKNIYNLRQFQYRVFDVFDIDQQRYLSPSERSEAVKMIGAVAPVIHEAFSFGDADLQTIQKTALAMADGFTRIVPEMGDLKNRHLREGLVFKANSETRFSFKAISDAYLAKQKD